MLILNLFLIPLLALVLLGIVFIMGTIGLVNPKYTTRYDQSIEAHYDESFSALSISSNQAISPLPTGELANPALNMKTTNDQLDYGLNSLDINI
jgi:hypothetical protein